MRLARAALLALAAAFAGCERVEVSNSTIPPKDGSQTLTGTPSSPATLIDRIAHARDTTRFQGVRRVEIHFEDGGHQRDFQVRERVSADGHGAYAIEALDVLDPAMSDAERGLFLTLQSVRQGMNWRYRDFSIDQVQLFLQNYRTTDTGVPVDVAGVSCLDLVVERPDGGGSIYSLAVHSPTGLVLRSHEETHEGVVVAEMVYESISFAPDLSAVAWHQSTNNEQPLPLNGVLLGIVGFEPRVPRSLPPGYQLLERSSLLHPQDGSPWVKATYGDGVETLFYLHGGPIVAGNGINSGVPRIEAELLEVTQTAPWIVARGNLRNERVIALGKVHEDELILMVRSAME
ncbi:MAG: hypothetical protein ABI054_05195 [Planctomycetota bacterium]